MATYYATGKVRITKIPIGGYYRSEKLLIKAMRRQLSKANVLAVYCLHSKGDHLYANENIILNDSNLSIAGVRNAVYDDLDDN